MQIIDETDTLIETCNKFLWRVENQGYYWDNHNQSEYEVILKRRDYNGGCHFINPLVPTNAAEKKKNRLPPAFKQFIDLDASPDFFIQFVNEFGPLIEMIEHPLVKKRESPLFARNFSKEEIKTLNTVISFSNYNKIFHSYSFYKETHNLLKIASKLSSLIKQHDHESLYDFFIGSASTNGADSELLELDLESQKLRQQYDFGSYIKIKSSSDLKAAIVQLKSSNWALHLYPKRLPPHKSATISIYPSFFENQPFSSNFIELLSSTWLDYFIARNTTSYTCTYSLQYSQSKNKWYPLIVPTSLLATMWYQLCEEVAGNRKYKPCDICGKWQDITDNRKNWRYHTDCASKKRVDRYRNKEKDGGKTHARND